MRTQLDAFADRPGEAGMTVAASHADPHDIQSVRLFVQQLASTGESFTSEQVTAQLSDAQRERLSAFPNALGGIFYQMQKEGTIRGIGYRTAQRPGARGRPIRLWQGTHHAMP